MIGYVELSSGAVLDRIPKCRTDLADQLDREMEQCLDRYARDLLANYQVRCQRRASSGWRRLFGLHKAWENPQISLEDCKRIISCRRRDFALVKGSTLEMLVSEDADVIFGGRTFDTRDWFFKRQGDLLENNLTARCALDELEKACRVVTELGAPLVEVPTNHIFLKLVKLEEVA